MGAILVAALLAASGCARVNLGLDETGKIGFDKAGGYCSPERGLAIKKLEDLPVLQPGKETPVSPAERKGYWGVVFNEDRYQSINIKLNGPDPQAFNVLPGQQIDAWLIPGNYTAISTRNGRQVGTWEFKVDGSIKNFQGKKVHWYVGWAQNGW